MAGAQAWRYCLFLACIAPYSLVAALDYYEILEVTRVASDAQIKRSYRKLALKYHPDKVTGSDKEKKAAAKRFADINNAYEALSDPEKRQIYDQHGEEGLKQKSQGGGQRGGGDMFDFFFGNQGFGGRGEPEEEQIRKGHDVYVDLWVTLQDLYLGKEIPVVRDKAVIKPAAGTRKCKCKNKMATRQLGPGMFQQYTTQVCEDCPNVKLEREQSHLNVHLEPGTPNGHHISFFEEGEPLVDGEPGDLKFVVRTLPHDKFERRANDIMLNMTIPLIDALTGFTREIQHVDGHTVTLKVDDVTTPGEYQFVKGEGMPIFQESHMRGDLWVQYTIAFPATLTSQQKEELRRVLGSADAAAAA